MPEKTLTEEVMAHHCRKIHASQQRLPQTMIIFPRKRKEDLHRKIASVIAMVVVVLMTAEADSMIAEEVADSTITEEVADLTIAEADIMIAEVDLMGEVMDHITEAKMVDMMIGIVVAEEGVLLMVKTVATRLSMTSY